MPLCDKGALSTSEDCLKTQDLSRFNWNIIALQCYVTFFCTVRWISHRYAYMPALVARPPRSPSHPSRSSQHQAEIPVLDTSFPLASCFTYCSVYTSVPLSKFIPPRLHPHCVHMSILYVCVCSPALETVKAQDLKQTVVYSKRSASWLEWFHLVLCWLWG